MKLDYRHAILRRLTLLITFLCLNLFLVCQNDLKSDYLNSKSENEKLKTGIAYLSEIKYSEPELTIKTSDTLIKLCDNTNEKYLVDIYSILGASYWHLGELSKSTNYFKLCYNKSLQFKSNKDILSSLNYGIFFLEHHEYDLGVNLLANQVNKIDQFTRISCIANMAFYSIKNKNIEKGNEYLSYLASEIISRGINLQELPCFALKYIKNGEILEKTPDVALQVSDEGIAILESTPDVVLQVIDDGIAAYTKIHNDIAPEILALRQLYKEFVDTHQRQYD